MAATYVWRNQRVAARIATETEIIVAQVYRVNHLFFSSKSFNRIICGLFFLLAYKYNAVMSERKIAEELGTSEVTVRLSYREWLETFPELFKHIVPKLSENVMLRPFGRPR